MPFLAKIWKYTRFKYLRIINSSLYLSVIIFKYYNYIEYYVHNFKELWHVLQMLVEDLFERFLHWQYGLRHLKNLTVNWYWNSLTFSSKKVDSIAEIRTKILKWDNVDFSLVVDPYLYLHFKIEFYKTRIVIWNFSVQLFFCKIVFTERISI